MRQKAAAPYSDKGARSGRAHRRVVLLHRLHDALIDRRYRTYEAVPTGRAVELDDPDAASEHKTYPSRYSAVPRLVLRWVHQVLPRDLSAWTFIDIGAGRGRAMMVAAGYPYAAVTGIETANALASAAERNLVSYPQRFVKARDVTIVRQNALAFAHPEVNSVYLIFDPFGPEVMTPFMDNLEASYQRAPRPIVCVLVDPEHEAIVRALSGFAEHRLPRGVAAKLALFSPYPVRIYRSWEAAPYLR